MCYYITATIPKNTPLNRVEPIFTSCKLGFDPIENPSIQALIGADRLYFKPTLTDCDCDTTLCGLNTEHAYKPEALQKQAELERQQDWLLKEFEWREAISKIFSSGLITEFGLLLIGIQVLSQGKFRI